MLKSSVEEKKWNGKSLIGMFLVALKKSTTTQFGKKSAHRHKTDIWVVCSSPNLTRCRFCPTHFGQIKLFLET